LTAFAEMKSEFDELGINIFAASADPMDKAQEVANELNFPVGYEVSRDIADNLGAWWEEQRKIIQPAEFIFDNSGYILASSYSCGPLGRMDAADVVKLVKYFEAKKTGSN
jgi:peroxiredoxin